MAVIENLDIVLGARTEKYDRGLDLATGRLGKFQADVNLFGQTIDATMVPLRDFAGSIWASVPGSNAAASAFTGMQGAGLAAGASLAGAFVAVASAAAAARIVIAGVSEEMGRIDELSDAANKLGITFADLASLQLGLGQASGLDAEGVNAGIQRMTLTLVEAQDESSKVGKSLRAIGLDAGALLRAGPVAALQQIAAATQQMKSPTDQLALAYQLFGKQGVALVSALREGPDAIAAMRAEAEQLNLTLTQAQANQVGAANDAWEKVQEAANGVFRQIAAEGAPTLQALAESILDIVRATKGWESSLPAIVDYLTIGLGVVMNWVQLLARGAMTLEAMARNDWGAAASNALAALDASNPQQMLAAMQAARAAARDGKAAPNEAELANLDELNQAEQQRVELIKQQGQARAAAEQTIAQTLQSLRDQVFKDQFGTRAFDEMKLMMAGATNAQVNEFNELRDAIDAAKQAKEQLERGGRLAEQFATPQEAFDKKIADLKQLMDVGAINERTFLRASAAAVAEFAGKQAPTAPPSPAAANRGSADAYSQALRNERASRQEAIAEQQRQAIVAGNELLKGIGDKLDKLGTVGAV